MECNCPYWGDCKHDAAVDDCVDYIEYCEAPSEDKIEMLFILMQELSINQNGIKYFM